jgi:hypothetical protein
MATLLHTETNNKDKIVEKKDNTQGNKNLPPLTWHFVILTGRYFLLY